ncbi:MAG: 5-deoxy-glucuronate isomerase [Kiritimatiellae bacterium]|nr:5-deoxy-glucuronate isomerase [Kiritimatiellia bacterium]MBQ3342221.1 5-deoxy-glucuronate isomerase [Kiritimatiellia bacterium]
MNLRVKLSPQQGYNKIFDVGEYGMKLTKFGLLKLAKGTSYEGDTGESEVAFVLIGGKFRATARSSVAAAGAKEDAFEVANGRTSPFTGKPHCLYLPRRTKYTITALTDVELAYNGSPATRDTAKPTLIKPEDTRHIALGRDNWTRTSEIILDEKFDSEHFYIGEGMIPSGNWSGYPSHRHDVNNPPAELDMEETYFYLFDPPQGFGFQSVYKPDGSLNEAYRVQSYDTVAIAEGYHPLVGAPGYQMYYLWTMAGSQGRGLISSMDPAHAWVKDIS